MIDQSSESRSAVESSIVAAARPTVHHHLADSGRSNVVWCLRLVNRLEPARRDAVSDEMSGGAADTPLQQLTAAVYVAPGTSR